MCREISAKFNDLASRSFVLQTLLHSCNIEASRSHVGITEVREAKRITGALPLVGDKPQPQDSTKLQSNIPEPRDTWQGARTSNLRP